MPLITSSPFKIEPPPSATTVLLLHMDNTTTDETGNQTFSLSGGAAFSTTNKFGTHSLLSTGSADHMRSGGHSSDLEMGGNDFTIEAQVRISGAIVSDGYIVSTANGQGGSNEGWVFWTYTGRELRFSWTKAGNPALWDIKQSTLTVPNDSAFHHVAVMRNGNDLIFGLDGSIDSYASFFNDDINDGTRVTAVGNNPLANGNPWNGYIDEVRVSTGLALYTTAYTPPTGPFTL